MPSSDLRGTVLEAVSSISGRVVTLLFAAPVSLEALRGAELDCAIATSHSIAPTKIEMAKAKDA